MYGISGTLQNQSPDIASNADAEESNDEMKYSDTFNLIEKEGEQNVANVEAKKVIPFINIVVECLVDCHLLEKERHLSASSIHGAGMYIETSLS